MKKDERITNLGIAVIFIFVFGIIFAIIISIRVNNISDDGNYDYCIEWLGFGNGTIRRDNLIYDCYSLSSQTFKCDYKILANEILMIKVILNITKNSEGEITEIIYDDPIYHYCNRWLKSKR